MKREVRRTNPSVAGGSQDDRGRAVVSVTDHRLLSCLKVVG